MTAVGYDVAEDFRGHEPPAARCRACGSPTALVLTDGDEFVCVDGDVCALRLRRTRSRR